MAGKNKSHATGADQLLSHEVVICGRQLPCNAAFDDWWKNHFGDRADKVTACLNKSSRWTGVIKIGGALWFTLWDSTEPAIALSSCAPVTRMSALSQLNNSGENSRGFYER